MSPRLSLRKLMCLSLAVGLLAAFLAPGPAPAQGPPGSQGLWQTFTTANSGLIDNSVTALLEDRAGGLWVGTGDPFRGGGEVSRYCEGAWQTFSAETGELSSNWVSALLEERAALRGMDVPTSLLNEMDNEREAIARIEAELEQMRGKT